MKNILLYILLSLSFTTQQVDSKEIEYSGQLANSNSLVDTLGIVLDVTERLSISPGDVVMGVFTAPGDLTMKGVGVDVAAWNTDASSPKLKIEVYKPGENGYPFTSTGSMYDFGATGQDGWIGYAHPAENDSIAYPDINTAPNLIWNSFNAGAGVCTAELEVANGQPVWGEKVLPAGSSDVVLQKPTDETTGLFYADLAVDGGAQFVKDELMAAVITYLVEDAGDSANDATTIELNAVEASYFYPSPGLQYFAVDCGGPSGERGWHIMPEVGEFKYLVDITGDIPPEINIFHVGTSSTEGLPDSIPPWTQVRVMATANDQNPSGGSDGIERLILHYQLNSLTANASSAIMMMAYNMALGEYVYFTDIPGQTNGTTVYWWVSAEDVEGNISITPKRSYTLGAVVSVDEINPDRIDLLGNFPNPFNPITTISYSMDEISDVSITILNIRGQVVKNLFTGRVNTGEYSVSWNGTDQFGQAVPSGLYIYQLQSNDRILTAKMMLIK